MLVFAFASSWISEMTGIQAFFAGVIWPRNNKLVEEAAATLEPITTVVLIPLFSCTRIRTNLGLIAGGRAWAYEAAIIAVAVAGKMGGAFIGATIMKFGIRDSLAVGALLNTRGLVELVL